jgi:hypothetical protein
MIAHAAFVESARVVLAHGLPPETIHAALRPALRLLGDGLAPCAEAIGTRQHDTDQATLDVFLSAVRSYRSTADDVHADVPFMATLQQVLESAVCAGWGPMGPSALIETTPPANTSDPGGGDDLGERPRTPLNTGETAGPRS